MLLPSVYGDGGALFAFSAMDGLADWRRPVVASTIPAGRGLLFHMTGNPVLRFGLRLGQLYVDGETAAFDSMEDEIVAGSLIQSRVRVKNVEVRLTCVLVDNETVCVEASLVDSRSDADVFVQCLVDGARASEDESALVFAAGGNYCALAAGRDCEVVSSKGLLLVRLSARRETARFAWSCSRESAAQALEAARQGQARQIDEGVKAQIGFFENLPEPKTDDVRLASAYYKAASVLKLNCWSPQGIITYPWTTPDRWPHAHMWLWDSAFHAIGLRHISHDWAENAIRAMLSVQREDGYIPITARPDPSKDSSHIQPPILAWASWKVYESTLSKDFLDHVYARIGSFIRYVMRAHDSDGNGLAEWFNQNASGMDNSPRFDQPVKDAIDLNCYVANDVRFLARIARELGKQSDATEWDSLADQLSARIESSLWDEETGFYYDNSPDGQLVKIKTIAGFTPLFAGVCIRERAESLLRHLTDPNEFWRKFPVPSVAADEPSFCDNMWRGPVWINCNYFIIEGLRRYAYHELASDLAERTVKEIARWYASDGIIYEFYDSEGRTNPAHLHRKKLGGPDARRGIVPLATSVCDYNWTAALFIDLLLGAIV